MPMPIVQHIHATTAQGADLDISVIEYGESRYATIMSATTFPLGTFFPTAEDAVIASVRALNGVVVPDKITSLQSRPVEEFVPNSRLAQLV